MNNLSRFFFRAWRPAVLVASLGLVAYLLYFHNLAHLLPGYDARELRVYDGASNWHAIATNPINAPYKALVWLAVALGHHSILITRYVAASFGILAVMAFFMITRPWHGFRVAFLATLLFATSAGFLHITRLGSASILQMSVLVFMGMVLWYRHKIQQRALVTYALLLVLALLCYVPGMIWFELFGLALLQRDIRRRLRETSYVHKTLGILLFLAVVTPLGLAIFHTPDLALRVTGLPQNLAALKNVPTHMLNAVLSIGIHSNGNSESWLGHRALLSSVEFGLAILGTYFYIIRERSNRAIFLLGSLVLGLLLVGMGSTVGYACILPPLYLLVASGLEQLLGQWLKVFPRNPIARLAGISLVCLMLAFSVLYQVRSYFVAWPHNAATRQTFNKPQP